MISQPYQACTCYIQARFLPPHFSFFVDFFPFLCYNVWDISKCPLPVWLSLKDFCSGSEPLCFVSRLFASFTLYHLLGGLIGFLTSFATVSVMAILSVAPAFLPAAYNFSNSISLSLLTFDLFLTSTRSDSNPSDRSLRATTSTLFSQTATRLFVLRIQRRCGRHPLFWLYR